MRTGCSDREAMKGTLGISLLGIGHPAPKRSMPATDTAMRLTQRGRAGLVLLLEAHECAQELARTPWDFAVEIQSLREQGLTSTDFRWLACKGYVGHAQEVTSVGEKARAFQPDAAMAFSDRTCFVLTDDGVDFVRRSFGQPASDHVPVDEEHHSSPKENQADLVPTWDHDRQELRMGRIVIKQFKAPAANQEMILAAFQEEGWPPRIDDPLPQNSDQDPKRRLHDTINSLNRNQKHPLVRFLGDGSGQGVRWDLAKPLSLTGTV